MRPVLLLLTICLAIFSCDKTETIDLDSILACHQSQQLDSAAISTKLVGTWSLSSRFCIKTRPANLTPFDIKVNINADGSFSVSEHSGILTQGNWKLKNIGTSMWGFDLTSQSEYLNGRILFCKNQVLFDSTYVNGEGCYNIFYK